MHLGKFVILLILIALSLAIPALLLAQGSAPPHQFLVVDARIDGVAAPNGSSIVALIDTRVVARDQIMGRLSVANFIRLRVEPPSGQSYVGKLVTFEVNGYRANQSYLWESGGQNRVELTAGSVTPTPVVPTPTAVVPTPTSGQAAASPHQFLVVDARIDGVAAPTNSSIVALIDTQVVARDQIMGRLSVSNFIRLRVEPPSGQSYVGKLVTFEINGYQANQSYLWESGGQNRVELTAVSATPTAVVPATSTPTPLPTSEPFAAPTSLPPETPTAPVPSPTATRTPTPTNTPAPTATQSPSLSSGYNYSCLLRSDGSVVCRGSDTQGQSTPPEGERFTAISSGFSHTCGLREDGTVSCWGSDTRGQSTPPEGQSFTAISSGLSHTCGHRDNGELVCWGGLYGTSTE